MKKIMCIIFITIVLLPFNTYAINYTELHYKNAIIYDVTDEKILYELNSE